jgi:hypothetical protein
LLLFEVIFAKTIQTCLANNSAKALNQNSLRLFSSTKLLNQESTPTKPANQDLFYIDDHRDKGYVIFKLNKAPVNSLSLEFLTELNIQMDKFQEAKDIKGVILTSNAPNIFSAGLDIMEMYQPKPDRIRQFWSALQNFWLKLYGSNKIFIAAINVKKKEGEALFNI